MKFNTVKDIELFSIIYSIGDIMNMAPSYVMTSACVLFLKRHVYKSVKL